MNHAPAWWWEPANGACDGVASDNQLTVQPEIMGAEDEGT